MMIVIQIDGSISMVENKRYSFYNCFTVLSLRTFVRFLGLKVGCDWDRHN